MSEINDGLEYAVRTVDALRGTKIRPARSRADAVWATSQHNAIYATRNTYTGYAEAVCRVRGSEWQAVL